MSIKLLLIVSMLFFSFLVSTQYTNASGHVPGWTACELTLTAGQAIEKGIGCECGNLVTSTTVLVEVECDEATNLVCSNNKFNPESYSVCLRRTGGSCIETSVCEGGAECSTSPTGNKCIVDLGENSLAGVVGNTTTDIRETIRRVINVLLGFLGIVTVLMIIYGGVLWLTAAGNEEKIDKGRHTITWAAIGAIIISIAWTITSYVLNVGKSI